jgi:hypothetical protein
MRKKAPCREAPPVGGRFTKRIIREREIGGLCRRGRFRGIRPLAHRSNAPLQVLYEETTPILGIGSLPVTDGLLLSRIIGE